MPRKPRPAGLPDFARPPITEAVLSIQFATVAAFRSAHVGLLWEQFRATYPTVSEHPPIQPIFETFGTRVVMAEPMIQIETLLSPPMPRFWLEATDGSLLQLQQDRILHNWRKLESDQEYPRYEALRDEFQKEVGLFVAFLARENLGEMKVNQCEVTYVNTIQLADGSHPHRSLGRITPLWADAQSTDHALKPEGAQITARYFMTGDGDTPIGRVHVVFTPGFMTADLAPVVKLELTARGKPASDTVDSAFDFLARARAEVVRTFAAVTTPEMHDYWGMNDGRG